MGPGSLLTPQNASKMVHPNAGSRSPTPAPNSSSCAAHHAQETTSPTASQTVTPLKTAAPLQNSLTPLTRSTRQNCLKGHTVSTCSPMSAQTEPQGHQLLVLRSWATLSSGTTGLTSPTSMWPP